ncbi:arsenate reductase [Thiomonas sp.]|jgi:Spx/MgsR family transcriptional regulator|uniref:Arsenate reductase-like protein n=1 Tax=Thiomonas intermedia (strain K12) TaxID=75379 RepID=D5X4N4_THIK1|nr:arsenate reductase [Thiomonas sp.]
MNTSPVLTVYGLNQCDTVKRARQWLQAQCVDFQFVDFKKTPPSAAQISAWAEAVGWEALLNKRGTTWRKLDAATQARVVDATSAVAVLAEHPSAIKRPVVETGGQLLVGFDEADWRAALSPFLPPFS